MGAALKFKQSQVPRQQGEYARLKVIRGPDAGTTFVVQGGRATIGRGEENDIVLTDLKASRRHAELVMTPSGWVVQDLGSANGILCNGKAARSGSLQTKDTLGLGETLFEFMTQEAPTILLQSPAPTEKQINAEQAGLAVQKAKIIAMSQFGGLAKNVPRPDKISEKWNEQVRTVQNGLGLAPAGAAASANANKQADPKRLLLIVAVIAAGYFLMDGPVKKKITNQRVNKNKTHQEENYIDSSDEAQQIEKTAELFYLEGFREYNQGNYLRARTQFETVLQMMPSHGMAKRYLENANKSIEDSVRLQLFSGRRAQCSGKLREARGHYEHVLRLLYRDPNNPAYIQAKDHLNKLGSKTTSEECKG